MDIENIRKPISEFLTEYVEAEPYLTPSGILPDDVIYRAVSKLVLCGAFDDMKELEAELLKSKGVLVSFNEYFGINE
jgi:hypothetical protein